MSEPRIKIIRIPYRHHRTGALIIHFRFDNGFRSNVNIPPQELVGLSEEEIEQYVIRTLESIYEEKNRVNEAEKTKIDKVIKKIEKLEIS